ncbi:hypothetical protein C8R44DRAFT_732819 [Mycena epipterygia]|nr:hypothetical protein C8R44DRAFT_732819 [Mycena epipterygia]
MLVSTFCLSALAFLAVSSAAPTDVAHTALTTSSDALPRLTKSSDATFAGVNKSLDTSEHKNSAIIRITYVSAKGVEGHPVTVARDVLPDTCYPFSVVLGVPYRRVLSVYGGRFKCGFYSDFSSSRHDGYVCGRSAESAYGAAALSCA